MANISCCKDNIFPLIQNKKSLADFPLLIKNPYIADVFRNSDLKINIWQP